MNIGTDPRFLSFFRKKPGSPLIINFNISIVRPLRVPKWPEGMHQ